MTELRLHRELYDGKAVDAAVRVYERHARFELAEEPAYWVVRVDGNRHERVARELANYALGLTVQARSPRR